jgi:biopolymer transport protein ExbD
MKFPRNSKILRSQFDIAPFAAVFFLLAIFLLVSSLMPVPGVRGLQLPEAANLPGINTPGISVAVDSVGRLYYDNAQVDERQLKTDLREAAHSSAEPLTLVIHADKSVTYDQLIHLVQLAQSPGVGGTNGVGITNFLFATLPRVYDAPAAP